VPTFADFYLQHLHVRLPATGWVSRRRRLILLQHLTALVAASVVAATALHNTVGAALRNTWAEMSRPEPLA